MGKQGILVVKPGHKFRHKRKGTVYIIKNVENDSVLMVSEEGDAIMRIHLDTFLSSDFEPIYD